MTTSFEPKRENGLVSAHRQAHFQRDEILQRIRHGRFRMFVQNGSPLMMTALVIREREPRREAGEPK